VKRRQRIDDLLELAVPEQPALSPDAATCAYVLRTADAETDKPVRALWCLGIPEGEPRQLTRGPSDSSPAWAPDGKCLVVAMYGSLWRIQPDRGTA